jgi:hypothetical protein
MKKQLTFTEQDFLNLFSLPKPSFADFCNQIQILDISDKSGTFKVRQDLDSFIARVGKKDNRAQRLPLFKQKLYQLLVTDIDATLKAWFRSQGALPEKLEFYFDMPNEDILTNDVFAGRTNAKYGKICKNINFANYYNTKKWYANDSEYVFGLLKFMVEDFRLRNSLVGPAFFDQICQYDGDSSDFWRAFMMGANRPSTFNPATYKGILDSLFEGETLFAPVMGWNAYQTAFYSSKFKKFVATDVIPDVVDNGRLLHTEFLKYQTAKAGNLFNSMFETEVTDTTKEVDLYLCPSEQLDARHNFIAKYSNQVDAVLFSPPYFDLEIYDSEDQSFTNFPNYEDWLAGYWEETVKLAKAVMKPGARFGFVISNYRNSDKVMTNISEDMRAVVAKHLTQIGHYRVQWSAMGGSRQAKKTRGGNFEDLWLFELS